MGERIKPEQVEKVIMEAITKYGDEVSEKTEAICKDTARQARRELKGSAPTGGEYARGWSQRMQGKGLRKSAVVFNRKYQLVHLLEKPHATGRYKGGSYPKHVDYTGTVERVEEKFSQEFFQEVLNKL